MSSGDRGQLHQGYAPTESSELFEYDSPRGAQRLAHPLTPTKLFEVRQIGTRRFLI